ncbi:unnamed protein product [Rotaria magnacalcarata]|uniref:Homeobox domain-containing protein n=1 Tax=Rotaria magnacalcarata TaxID=392030 RepID=A0A819RX95_9BILA|nr:unnamed protein product [Rotaria magnacalcarata]CAF4055003.1 unnamed protein product [Rotaria magnacalcarata]
MDSFIFDFDTDSTLTNDTSSTQSDLDWTAFQSTSPLPTTSSPFTPLYVSPQDDAVAPNNKSTIIKTTHDDELYFEIEHFFNGLNQQHQEQAHSQHLEQGQQGIIESLHSNIDISDQTMNNRHYVESPSRAHLSAAIINEKPANYLPAPLVPRVSSSRSKYYHKLPDHAVKLMQEWYNANLDDPYPRSPDKKRFITEGNITAQQCRSWFANRRQRLKHVKRNQSKLTTSRFINHSPKANFRPTEMSPIEAHEYCYYCQQQQQQQQQIALSSSSSSLSSSPLSLTIPTTPSATTTTTTTLNVVINQQTSRREEIKSASHSNAIFNSTQIYDEHLLLRANKRNNRGHVILAKICLVLAWTLLFIVAYHAPLITTENEDYDPFAILGVDKEVSRSEIKRGCRELSKINHSDGGGGDPEEFKKIAEACRTLTNAESKENWKKYGNPGGKRVCSLGCAIRK